MWAALLCTSEVRKEGAGGRWDGRVVGDGRDVVCQRQRRHSVDPGYPHLHTSSSPGQTGRRLGFTE